MFKLAKFSTACFNAASLAVFAASLLSRAYLTATAAGICDTSVTATGGGISACSSCLVFVNNWRSPYCVSNLIFVFWSWLAAIYNLDLYMLMLFLYGPFNALDYGSGHLVAKVARNYASSCSSLFNFISIAINICSDCPLNYSMPSSEFLKFAIAPFF